MTGDEVLHGLRAHKAILRKRFGVAEVALFGSFPRDQAKNKSDIDVLARSDRAIHWERYFDT